MTTEMLIMAAVINLLLLFILSIVLKKYFLNKLLDTSKHDLANMRCISIVKFLSSNGKCYESYIHFPDKALIKIILKNSDYIIYYYGANKYLYYNNNNIMSDRCILKHKQIKNSLRLLKGNLKSKYEN